MPLNTYTDEDAEEAHRNRFADKRLLECEWEAKEPTQRERFEYWMRREVNSAADLSRQTSGEAYFHVTVQIAWRAWQAAQLSENVDKMLKPVKASKLHYLRKDGYIACSVMSDKGNMTTTQDREFVTCKLCRGSLAFRRGIL